MVAVFLQRARGSMKGGDVTSGVPCGTPSSCSEFRMRAMCSGSNFCWLLLLFDLAYWCLVPCVPVSPSLKWGH